MPQVRRQGAWLWLLVAAALLSQTALNLVRPVTTYKLLELEASAFTVGLVAAAYAVLPLVSAMWLGRLASRAGGLGRMVAVGVAVLGVGAAGLALAPNPALVGAASAVLGMGHLVFTIAGQSAVARYASDDQLDKGFGWFTAAYSAGQLAGPLAGGLMLGAGSGGGSPGWPSSITLALWVGAAMSLAALPLMLLPSRLTAGTGPARGPRDEAGEPERAATRDPAGESPLAEPAGRATLGRILRVPGVGSHMMASLALLAMLDILIAFLPPPPPAAGRQ
jgi:MFS family permease